MPTNIPEAEALIEEFCARGWEGTSLLCDPPICFPLFHPGFTSLHCPTAGVGVESVLQKLRAGSWEIHLNSLSTVLRSIP